MNLVIHGHDRSTPQDYPGTQTHSWFIYSAYNTILLAPKASDAHYGRCWNAAGTFLMSHMQ